MIRRKISLFLESPSPAILGRFHHNQYGGRQVTSSKGSISVSPGLFIPHQRRVKPALIDGMDAKGSVAAGVHPSILNTTISPPPHTTPDRLSLTPRSSLLTHLSVSPSSPPACVQNGVADQQWRPLDGSTPRRLRAPDCSSTTVRASLRPSRRRRCTRPRGNHGQWVRGVFSFAVLTRPEFCLPLVVSLFVSFFPSGPLVVVLPLPLPSGAGRTRVHVSLSLRAAVAGQWWGAWACVGAGRTLERV